MPDKVYDTKTINFVRHSVTDPFYRKMSGTIHQFFRLIHDSIPLPLLYALLMGYVVAVVSDSVKFYRDICWVSKINILGHFKGNSLIVENQIESTFQMLKVSGFLSVPCFSTQVHIYETSWDQSRQQLGTVQS